MKIGRRDFGVPGVKTISHLSKTFVFLLAKNIFQELNSTLYLCWPRASLKNAHLMQISPVCFRLVRVRLKNWATDIKPLYKPDPEKATFHSSSAISATELCILGTYADLS
jgi:hypothetical protein